VDFGMGTSGRAWWHIDMMRLQLAMMRGLHRELASEHPEGMPAAAEALRGCLWQLQQDHGISSERLVIGGFSQGAMLTTEIALQEDEPFAGLVVLSGTLLCEDRWREAAALRASRLAVYQSHGRQDPILPYAGAEALRDLLSKGGAQVTFRGFSGQHEIPFPILEGLGLFLQQRFGGG
ncbi:MAG: phospholipase, partial [Myxococcales bacterium]|nr:phospholipase [Myxococcales bacterium]